MRGGGAYGTSRGLVGGRVGVSRMDSFLAGTITPRQSARDPAEVEWAYLLLVQDRLAWVGFPPRMVLADGHVERDGIVHVVQPDYTHLSLNSPSRESDIERPHDKS